MHQTSRPLIFVKKCVLTSAILIGSFVFLRSYCRTDTALASASGPSPSHTNAPNEDNCTACHIGTINSGGGSVLISGIPPNYEPGQQVQLTVTTSHFGAVVYGFQLTAIDKDGKQAGAFTVPTGFPMRTQIVSGPVEGNERKYVEHTVDGVVPPGFDSNSWTFTWTAPALRVGKISFYAAGNGANGDGNTTDDNIYTTSRASLSGSAISNFDTDIKSDFAVWRPSTGVWYTLNTSDLNYQAVPWGSAGDRVVPGDYDGDGKTDIAVWRPSSGTWYVLNSSGGYSVISWGSAGDMPVQGDYDGDLKTDIAVWRPATGQWFILRSSDGQFEIRTWGVSSDKPVQADYDGDGKTDSVVYRPSDGNWYILRSSDFDVQAAAWGSATDVPVPGDYDGDGKSDLAVYRPSIGTWFVFRSSDLNFTWTAWGNSTDVPVPADYDGDGASDIAVYRGGTWYVLQSSNNDFQVIPWGVGGDAAISAAYRAQ